MGRTPPEAANAIPLQKEKPGENHRAQRIDLFSIGTRNVTRHFTRMVQSARRDNLPCALR